MITLSHTFDLVRGATAVYRAMLEAMANPGREVPFPVEEDPRLALAVTLLDGETAFHWDDTEMEQSVRFLTGAHAAPPQEADFLFAAGPAALAELLSLAKTGTFEDPHLSATLFVPVQGPSECCVLTGPGVKPGSTAELPQAVLKLIDLRDSLGFEYPCGVDMVFLTSKGIIAIPRLTKRGME